MKKLSILMLALVTIFLLTPVIDGAATEPHTSAVQSHDVTHEGVQTSTGHDTHRAPHIDGRTLNIAWGLPFLAILLSIALFPLLAPHFWHHHYGKVSLAIGVTFFALFTIFFGPGMSFFYLVEVYLGEFIPFIVLLLALFTVAGGIQLKGELVGKPSLNVILILIGTALASWMGTTGAAMLLIRPLLRANAWRKNKVHVVVFFIFLVANIGGSLTPLGDPPLFLGFLKGVSFFWTTKHLIFPMLFASAVLIVIFFFRDTWYYRKEENKPAVVPGGPKLAIDGKINFLLLAGVVGAVVFSGLWHSDISNPADVFITFMGAVMKDGQPVNSAFFWATGALSSFLDNAPTYVVFFNTAGGNAAELMATGAKTLLAISCGAVFMGANTYIGNAPNFMVKSIAEESGVPMPSFFGYLLKYAIPILIPVFILITLIFF